MLENSRAKLAKKNASQDGTVPAVAAGEAIITASAGAYRASCTVTVTGADVDVLPSTEPTETVDQLPDGLNDEGDWSRSESEFEKGVKLHIMGPKPGDLPMVRLKWK